MARWADFVITQANFNSNKKIRQMKQCEDNGKELGIEKVVTRDIVIHNISKGKTYVTAFNGLSGMTKGQKISVVNVDNDFFLRVDKNQVGFDNLGPIVEFS